MFSRVIQEEMRANVAQGRLDRAVAIIKEAYEAGFDPFDAIEHDAEAAKLRSFKPYKDLVSDIDAKNLARARERVKEEFARTTSYVFDFNTKDLDGKPLSLDQFKGQVLLVDLWGTWCKPCREAIPGLIQLQHKHRRRGFDLIGLDYEQNVTDPAKTEQLVTKFVQESGIPYRIAMFDDALQSKVPNVQGYPTTLLIDRAGKVRLQITGGGPEALAVIDAGIEVLLAEPGFKPAAPSPAPADAKAEARPK